LILTPTPGLDRYEIFRDSIWITLYSDKGVGLTFPRALRFTNDSVIYRATEAECIYSRENPSTRVIQIPRTIPVTEKLRLFEDIFGNAISAAEYDSLKTEYLEFSNRFVKEVGLQ
jgi:hypothetical protein